ncbi:Glycoside-hydrolase family GH114 [Tenacibaculum sp. MAR_2009_124]|uniref:endo alpha-1,4 polygalactosaminidase n=1 Tax=Tenacibaculum sp. MAR_2009_124 TaxID=1250059 RepID=UPI000895BDDC|nr:endo alpha-1,4 polygalactosaminidase [Tenacibaculum sp. MAR_2009_124]SEB66014.1 Glycoside-hydrolase family GH114 [Tenacibaculum sp. MAR_2009_124]
MLHYKYLLVLLSSVLSFKSFANLNNVFLSYGKVPIQKIRNYTYVILEASHYTAGEVAVLKQYNRHVLCYISLGEVNKYTPFYEQAKSFVLSGKNEIWNSYYLDLEKKPLQKILMKDIKDKIKVKGFDGLFLDNIDNYGMYGKQKFLQKYLLSFLIDLKKQYSGIYLMQNAGLDLIKMSHNLVDSVAVESVITSYSFEKKKYQFRKKKEFQHKAINIKKIEQEYNIPFIIIEYMDSDKGKNKILRKLKKFNWNVFVGQIDLQNTPIFK